MSGDLHGLASIMTGDSEMTWPRKVWSTPNVEYLLNHRLAHYRQYGFGPYAIIKGGALVGMAGVQVWDYAPCSIEVLVYVARPLWSRGLAAHAMQWVLQRAKDVAHEPVLYAATRPENARAERIAKRSGFTKIGSGEHYGYLANFWKLELS
jgi:RimJ/RimL family protein N-acetyltransferase